jgi:hypothetical protein
VEQSGLFSDPRQPPGFIDQFFAKIERRSHMQQYAYSMQIGQVQSADKTSFTLGGIGSSLPIQD